MVPELYLLGGAILIISMAPLLPAMLKAAANLVENFPGVGGWLADKVRNMAQAISNALGDLLGGIYGFIGTVFHWIARFLGSSWGIVREIAHTVELTAEQVYRAVVAIHPIRAIVNALHTAWKGIEAGVKELHKLWRGIEARLAKLEHQIAKGIGHDLRIFIKALEADVQKIISKDLKAIRSDIATADAAIENLYEWAKGKASLLGVGTFAVAVATALAALGLDWIKCPNAKSNYDNRGCSTWSALDDLLGLVALGIVADNFETLVGEAQDLTEGAVTVFDDVFGLSR